MRNPKYEYMRDFQFSAFETDKKIIMTFKTKICVKK